MSLESLHYPLKLDILFNLSYPDIINLCLTSVDFSRFCSSEIAKPLILAAKLKYETLIYSSFIEQLHYSFLILNMPLKIPVRLL